MANESNSAPEAAPSTNYVDDLFDYDVGLDGILQEINTNSGSANAPKQSAPPDNSGVVLGLDEEVKVDKKRQPVAKLDENRLLTQAGIPKLRRSARKNLKFKGRGHEFSDLARLLNFYQLWLDDLFPRAKFADGLAIIERLGHSKRLQMMRQAWINEEKPKPTDDDTADPLKTSSNDENITNNDTSVTDTRQSITNNVSRSLERLDHIDEDLFIPDGSDHQQSANDGGASLEDDEFDELDALLSEHRHGPNIGKTASAEAIGNGIDPPYDDDFDELNALLREHEAESDLKRWRD
ncbi:replication fork protection component Swi3-domain-containing protein [Aspergillus varians]